ncbi:uncharacterized protein LOC144031129 isoform X2 [Festucalex cinctus]
MEDPNEGSSNSKAAMQSKSGFTSRSRQSGGSRRTGRSRSRSHQRGGSRHTGRSRSKQSGASRRTGRSRSRSQQSGDSRRTGRSRSRSQQRGGSKCTGRSRSRSQQSAGSRHTGRSRSRSQQSGGSRRTGRSRSRQSGGSRRTGRSRSRSRQSEGSRRTGRSRSRSQQRGGSRRTGRSRSRSRQSGGSMRSSRPRSQYGDVLRNTGQPRPDRSHHSDLTSPPYHRPKHDAETDGKWTFPLPWGVYQKKVLDLLGELRNESKHTQPAPSAIHTMETMEDFEREEQHLCEKQAFDALVLQLARIGGKDTKDCVNKILDKLFTNGLMAKFNMKGKGKKGKKPLEKTHVYKAIQDGVMKFDATATEGYIRHCASQHLKHAPQRQGGGGFSSLTNSAAEPVLLQFNSNEKMRRD